MATLPFGSVLSSPPRSSLHEGLLAGLRDFIVQGHLSDDERIPEKLLCEKFGVSRTPLREALKVLAAEGLIDLLPNRGARVRKIDPQERRELFDVMGGLEALAGRLACERATDEEIAAVELLHFEMYGHYLKRDLPAYFRCNQAIHRAILAAARNATLAATYETYAVRAKRIRFVANLDRQRDRWSAAMREHEDILEALSRRAGPELGDILFEHLRRTQAALDLPAGEHAEPQAATG